MKSFQYIVFCHNLMKTPERGDCVLLLPEKVRNIHWPVFCKRIFRTFYINSKLKSFAIYTTQLKDPKVHIPVNDFFKAPVSIKVKAFVVIKKQKEQALYHRIIQPRNKTAFNFLMSDNNFLPVPFTDTFRQYVAFRR